MSAPRRGTVIMQPGSVHPAGLPRRVFCIRETLPAPARLRRTADFQDAYAQDRRWHGRYMVLFLRAGADASLRLGVVASRRVGNAVERARAKRRLREAFRRQRRLFTDSSDDVVLVARRSILAAPWPAVVKELLALAVQAGLMPSPGR